MTRGRARTLLVLAVALPLAMAGRPAAAQFERPQVDQQVMVFIVDRVSFEQLLEVPDIRALARAGGAALLSPRTVPGDQGPGSYLTLGSGTRSAAPGPTALAFDREEMVQGRAAADLFQERYPGRALPLGPFQLDIDRYVNANAGRSVPGLLGRVLAAADRTVSVYGNADTNAGPNRPGFLVGMNASGAGALGHVGVVFAPQLGGGPPLLLPVANPTPDLLGGFRLNFDAVNLAALGGRIPSPAPYVTSHLTVFDMGDTLRIDAAAAQASPDRVARERRQALERIGPEIKHFVQRAAAHNVMVIVVGPSTSNDMNSAKDEVTPIVVAQGNPANLFPEAGAIHTLTSDTTRRVGVVSNEDVAPTILHFFGLFVPPEMHGLPIRIVRDEPAPFVLHERHLANRRMSVPVQTGAGLYVTIVGLICVALLVFRRRVPERLGHLFAWAALTAPALAVALLAAGHLQTLSYSTVVPFLIGGTLVGTLIFVPMKRFGLLVPPIVMGVAVLAYFAWEATVGWTAALTPFLGGSELDGARFFGLPNAFIGLLIGAGLYVAVKLPRFVGFALVALVALFAGLPGIGANLGGALAIFAAAGLWLSVRTWGRLSWKGAGLTLGVMVVGMAVVFASHVFLTASPTHGTRFVEGPGRGLSGIWHTEAGRLLVGWRLILDDPFALVPVVGTPICLLLVLRPPDPVRGALERHPEWRDAVMVILLASIVAYFANDSGAAAIGLGFATAVGGLLYVSLAEASWRTKAPADEMMVAS